MPDQQSKRGLARNSALYVAAFTFALAWLMLVRSILDGQSYEWATFYLGMRFSGAGLDGDFWLLIAQTALAFAILYLGFRKPGPLSYSILILWLALNTASWVYAYFDDPEALVFRGDTFGVSINIGILAIGVFGAALLAALIGAALEMTRGRRPPRFPWTRANTIALVIALAILPVQFLLLRFAVGRALADQVGVILTLLQWAAIVFALGLDRRK
jgi:hypothetical protein